MSAAHTPGPWLIRKGDEWTNSIVTAEGENTQGEPMFWEVASYNLLRPEARANARLIAAAPELLEACLAMLAWDEAEKTAKPFDADGGAGFYQRIGMCQDAFDKARAAIAKATDAPSRSSADTDRHGSDKQERESA